MKSKRILSLLLSLVMILSMAPASVFAETVESNEEIPYFEALEFMTTALASGAWVRDETFVPTTLTYDLPIKTYSTSSLTLQATTLYDTEKYVATAEYTDINGEMQSVTVNSGRMTVLANQPFDDSVMTITIEDKNNADNKTVYTFNVSRPRDTKKAIKSNGIVLIPTERDLSSTAYNGITEGVMQKADESGSLTSGKGVSGTQYYYRTFIYDDAESFALSLASSTAYAHIRYSTDAGSTWTETAQGGGTTDAILIPESGTAEILVQIIDDKAYAANIKAEKDGFEDTEPTQYKIWVDKVTLSAPKLLTAEVTNGDWYPAFDSQVYSYWVMVENEAEAPVLTYTAADGCTVKIGTSEQSAGEDGKYTYTLGTSQKSIVVTSEDGNFTNTYKFGYKKKSALDVPDKVVDYLCIGSQYTNVSYGINPEVTLTGSFKSLGNFGGYITYYYEEPVIDNPNNKFGLDFYVIGNSSEYNIDSMAELGQVYVSEDGEVWYALAGSEHYEDKAVWDYTITYTKDDDGKAYWADNYGNSIDYAAKIWPSDTYYYMNDVADEDSYTFTGILFESQLGSIMGDSSSTGSFAARAKFGYADYYASNVSGTTLTDVNSYAESPSKANGFDVAWAVDENGVPVDVSEKEFHYIKVATASNIYAGSFAEKSTEVAYVVRTTEQETAVGKTAAPAGVTISDGADSKTVNFTQGQKVYSVNLDNMKYVSVMVNGTAESDNIYVNNQRVASGISAEGFKVTKEKGETLVRIIVQNGDKEPVIYLLKLTSNACESDELIEGIKIDANGTVREADTKNSADYTASVGHRISSIAMTPITEQTVTVTVNGEALAEHYDLSYGDNTFEIAAADSDGNNQAVTLTVTRDDAPISSGETITVKFALYGDEEHGNDEVHTYKNDKPSLPLWISQKSYTVDSDSTVLDVFERALTEAELTWENDGGNYISEINGLAEFDNGALSGWMYFLNGTHAELGVAEQTLKNGDRIVFHYTDDYTQEQGSEKWKSSTSGNNSTKNTESGEDTAGSKAFDEIVSETAEYIYETVKNPQVGSIGGEWAILGLVRSGIEIPEEYYRNYYENAEEYIKTKKGVLHNKKYTEYSRLVLALTAMGKNPQNVAGYNILMPLGDYEKTIWQGINGPVWALIALDSGDYDMPVNPDAKVQATREMYINYILENQTPDGGWALSGDTADPDVTAMALQALAKYQDDKNVKAATEKALSVMSEKQDAMGGFSSWGTGNSESCAQIIVALCELGISINDSRFVKNGNTMLDNLLTYSENGKGFKHTKNGSTNLMATEQCFYALVALKRFNEGKNSLYRMGDAITITDEAYQSDGLANKNADVQKLSIVNPDKTFSDIQGHNNEAKIKALAARNIINGKTEYIFDPDATMTRAEFATIIVRGLGLPLKNASVFTDVTANDWYFDYVNTAYFYGIINGVSENEFNPRGAITREEAAVMTARAAKLCGMDTNMESFAARDILAEFIDYVKASGWAQTSLAFCYKEDILSKNVMEINPKETVTRAEVADMLYNMLSVAKLL